MSEMGVLKYNGVPASERTNTAREIEIGKRDNFIIMADTKLNFGERGQHCEVRVLNIVRRGIVWKASRQTLIGGQSRDRVVLSRDRSRTDLSIFFVPPGGEARGRAIRTSAMSTGASRRVLKAAMAEIARVATSEKTRNSVT
jgi:hypothetical protein